MKIKAWMLLDRRFNEPALGQLCATKSKTIYGYLPIFDTREKAKAEQEYWLNADRIVRVTIVVEKKK